MITTVLGAIALGAVIGALARLILPGRQSISLLVTVILGILGSLVGGIIVLTNARTIIGKDGLALDDGLTWLVYGLVWVAWIGAVLYSLRAHRAEVAADDTATAPAEEPVPA